MERRALYHDYLHSCSKLHAKLTEIRYGRPQNLDALQQTTSRIRSSRRLTYDDIDAIRNSGIWNADAFGYWPAREEIESILESKEWDLWNLPKREANAIVGLYRIFRQIEPVSVILRFVAPKHYGILSPPVEQVLGIGPFRLRCDKYMAYLKNLREIRDDRGFDDAADVDMALWVLQVGVLDGALEPYLPSEEYKVLREHFGRDFKLRTIRARNLSPQLFSDDIRRIDLAGALLDTDVELAGQIAGIEFERSLKRFLDAGSDEKLRDLVDRLPKALRKINKGETATGEIVTRYREALRTRNRAVHHDPRRRHLREHEVERLIDSVREIQLMVEAQHRKPEPVETGPGNVGTDTFPSANTDFWTKARVHELAAEQDVSVPQRLDAMVGAAADLWDDDADFDAFVGRIQARRGKAQGSSRSTG